MCSLTNVNVTDTPIACRPFLWSAIVSGVLIVLSLNPALAADVPGTSPLKIAVFDFELEDASAAGATSTGEPASDLARMQAVSAEARRVLAQSGRYSLIDVTDVDAQPVKERSLRSCGGCETALALRLGAQQSLIGVVTRVAKTEYYASVRITDTVTGKVVNEQSAFFTGADDAWPSGVRLLLKHAVLAASN